MSGNNQENFKNEWIRNQKSTPRFDEIKSVRPGEVVIETRTYHLNKLDNPIPYEGDSIKRATRTSRKDAQSLFERCFPDVHSEDKSPKVKNGDCFSEENQPDVFEQPKDFFTDWAYLKEILAKFTNFGNKNRFLLPKLPLLLEHNRLLKLCEEIKHHLFFPKLFKFGKENSFGV